MAKALTAAKTDITNLQNERRKEPIDFSLEAKPSDPAEKAAAEKAAAEKAQAEVVAAEKTEAEKAEAEIDIQAKFILRWMASQAEGHRLHPLGCRASHDADA